MISTSTTRADLASAPESSLAHPWRLGLGIAGVFSLLALPVFSGGGSDYAARAVHRTLLFFALIPLTTFSMYQLLAWRDADVTLPEMSTLAIGAATSTGIAAIGMFPALVFLAMALLSSAEKIAVGAASSLSLGLILVLFCCSIRHQLMKRTCGRPTNEDSIGWGVYASIAIHCVLLWGLAS